jgi:hypothetical protein
MDVSYEERSLCPIVTAAVKGRGLPTLKDETLGQDEALLVATGSFVPSRLSID